jgi:hypothetical protein
MKDYFPTCIKGLPVFREKHSCDGVCGIARDDSRRDIRSWGRCGVKERERDGEEVWGV